MNEAEYVLARQEAEERAVLEANAKESWRRTMEKLKAAEDAQRYGSRILAMPNSLESTLEQPLQGPFGVAPKGPSENVAIRLPVDPFLTSIVFPASFARYR